MAATELDLFLECNDWITGQINCHRSVAGAVSRSNALTDLSLAGCSSVLNATQTQALRHEILFG
jgi:hypothetical protein